MTAEEIAARIFEVSGICEIGELGLSDIAAQLLGDPGVCYCAGRIVVELRANPWLIAVNVRLSDPQFTLAVAWGLAQWWRLTRPGVSHEISSEAIATCLVLPRRALLEALDRLGEDVPALASEFVCEERVVRHRLASVNRRPLSGTRPRPVGIAS